MRLCPSWLPKTKTLNNGKNVSQNYHKNIDATSEPVSLISRPIKKVRLIRKVYIIKALSWHHYFYRRTNNFFRAFYAYLMFGFTVWKFVVQIRDNSCMRPSDYFRIQILCRLVCGRATLPRRALALSMPTIYNHINSDRLSLKLYVS